MSAKIYFIRKFVRALSIAILSGEWTEPAIGQRCRDGMGTKRHRLPWAQSLSSRIVEHFPTLPGFRELQQFVSKDPLLREWLKKTKRFPRFSRAGLPIVMLPIVAQFRQWQLPELTSIPRLAEWLGVSPHEIDWLADPCSWERHRTNLVCRNYRYRWLHKPGKVRLLESPKFRLGQLQRKILRGILDRIPPHQSAHGFRRGHSVATFATPHVEQTLVCRIDLQNFFAQIRRPRVTALFRSLGYPDSVAKILSALCTNAVPAAVLEKARPLMSPERCAELTPVLSSPHLPQGAPTSPALANLVAYRLDCRLNGLLQSAGGNYTRYADDLVFSGDRQFARRWPRLKVMILAIVMAEGFAIRERKTKTMFHSQQQRVAGLVLNTGLHTPRDEFDALKACLFNCQRFGPASQNHQEHADFHAHLLGRIQYIRQFQPTRANKLQRLIDAIDWTN